MSVLILLRDIEQNLDADWVLTVGAVATGFPSAEARDTAELSAVQKSAPTAKASPVLG